MVAGTDVPGSAPLGGLDMRLDDCVRRDVRVFDTLRAPGVPAVFLGGGYSRGSAGAIIGSVKALCAAAQAGAVP